MLAGELKNERWSRLSAQLRPPQSPESRREKKSPALEASKLQRLELLEGRLPSPLLGCQALLVSAIGRGQAGSDSLREVPGPLEGQSAVRR